MSTHDQTQSEFAPTVALDIRRVRQQDGAAIWNFVRENESLDSNSCYAYLLLCSDFADTCLIAHAGEQMVGFVAGYIPPNRHDVLFIWQIGVAPQMRGRGLGRKLLEQLLHGVFATDIRYLEATITPSNRPSWRLFQSLADSLDCHLTSSDRFTADEFGASGHEPEQLIRIGPLKE